MTNAQPAALATPPIEGKRPLVFYGWWIVIGAIVAQFIAMGQNQATNLILGPMTEELGWTRSQFILPTSIGVLFSGFLGFFVGAQVDRRGARPLLIIGTMVSSIALILLAYVEELWQFWLLRGLVLVAGNVMIGNLVVNSTISKWFVDRRGWAISMAALGVSGWSVLGTQFLRPIVDTYGWRAGWTTLGFATWILLVVAMLMRRQPEDYGLLPDGRRASDQDTESGRASMQRAAQDFARSFTRGEAARTPALWLLVLAFGFALTGMTALFAHMLQFFVDAGFTRTEAAYFYSTQGAFSLLAKFVWGGAMQRFPARFLVALAFSIAGSSTLGLVLVVQDAPWQLVAALSATWGLGTGGMIPLSEFVWASYFGRRYIGSVRGLGMPFTVMLTSVGPLYASTVFDRTGSYDIAMFTFVGLWFVGALLILTARRPHHDADRGVPLAHRLRQPEPPSHAAMAAVAGVEARVPSTDEPARGAEPAAAPREFASEVPAPAPVSPPAGALEAPPSAERLTLVPPPAPEPDAPVPLEPLAEEPPEEPAEEPAESTEPAAVEAVAPGRRRPPRSYMGEGPSASGAAPVTLVPPLRRSSGYMGEASAPRARPTQPAPAASRPVPVVDAPRARVFLNGASVAPALRRTPPPRDWRGAPPRHSRPAPAARARAIERPPRRDLEGRAMRSLRSHYVPQSTTSAILAGVATSVVATAALWLLTRSDGKRRS